MDIFAENLKDLRKEKQLSQLQLAKALNTTDDSIYSWEKGRSQPSIEMIRKICIFFDTTADLLIGLENSDGSKPQFDYDFEYKHGNTFLHHKEKK